MSLLKEIQQASDQNLNIFQSVHLPFFSLPGSTSLHGPIGLHRRTGKKQRQFWVSGEQILDYSSRNFHIDSARLSLRWSTVEFLNAFSTSLKVSSPPSSLCSRERKFILDRYLCSIVPFHHSSVSAVTQWCQSSVSRLLMSVTVPPGSDSWGKVSSARAPASHDTLLGTGLLRSLGRGHLFSWFILRPPKRLQGQCSGFF